MHVNGARCMLYAGPAARRAGIRCVWHVRVINRDRILERIRCGYASAVVANSKSVADTLKKAGFRTDIINVVYNGFRLGDIDAAKPLNLQREFGISAGRVLLGVGRFSRWKGFEHLIRASALLRAKSIDHSLLLVGKALPLEEDYENELKQLAGRCTQGNVVFAGWRDDVQAIMKAASVLVLPSRREPFGRVIVEAMACGLPVVATNDGGPAEIIKNGINGLLVPSGDAQAIASAVMSLMQNPELSAGIADEGRKRAREFDLVAHAERINEIYERILK